MPGRFMKLGEPGRWPIVITGIHSIRYQFPRETKTGQGPSGAGQIGWNWVESGRQCRSHGWTAHEGSPVSYGIVRYDQSFCLSNSPHAFTTPLSLAPSLSPLIPSTSIFPRSLSSSLSLPYFPSLFPAFLLSESSLTPSPTRYLHITSNASKVTNIPVSACQHIKTPPTLDGLYSSIDNFKLEGLILVYLWQKSISLPLSVPNPFSSVFRVHPELGWLTSINLIKGSQFRSVGLQLCYPYLQPSSLQSTRRCSLRCGQSYVASVEPCRESTSGVSYLRGNLASSTSPFPAWIRRVLYRIPQFAQPICPTIRSGLMTH